ncbi:MAG: hypothetical protein JWM56_1031 [Candidatus Peribacteria bacterium]|nr:hypothetical protein [Candidatus Peribacteria bacterium]
MPQSTISVADYTETANSATCLSPEVIEQHLWGHLPDAISAIVRAHCQRCLDCKSAKQKYVTNLADQIRAAC